MRLAIVAGLAVVYVVWGSTYLAIRFAIETIPPFLMAGSRFMAAGAVLYLFSRVRGVPQPQAADWRHAFATGALLLVGGNGLVTWGETSVPSGMAALVIGTTPLWFVVLDWLVFGGHRPTMRTLLGLGIGLAGVAMLVRADAGVDHRASAAGFAAILAAPVAWSLGSLYSKRHPAQTPLGLTIGMQMMAGGALMLVVGACTGEAWRLDLSRVSARSAAAYVYLVFVGSLLAFSVYMWLLSVAAPRLVATYAYVNPLVAVLLGWLLAGEPLDARMAAAAMLILGSVGLVAHGAHAKAAPAVDEPRDAALAD